MLGVSKAAFAKWRKSQGLSANYPKQRAPGKPRRTPPPQEPAGDALTVRRMAEIFGQMAAVEGRLQVRDWTDKDGAKRRSYEVIVDSLYFAGSKRQSEAQAEPGDFREIPEDEEGELPF